MNPVNATALYVSACRAVLQCDPRQPHTLAEMYKLLPFFRQSLSCLVCGNLLQDPIAPTNSTCQHYVCRACKGQRMQLKPSCSWCKDYSCFQENNQLSLLVNCYRQLCRYITHSPLLQQINSQLGGSLEVMTLLEEGLGAEGLETEEPSSPVLEELNPSVPLTPLTPPPPPLVHPPSLPHPAVPPPCLNGPQGCNGAVLEDLAPSSPELEVCDPVEEQPLGGGGLPEPEVTAEAPPEEGAGGGKREAGPGCGGLEVGLAPRPLAATTPGGVCSLREGGTASMEGEEGGVLLLSVEQVLQTLDPLHPSIDSHVPTYRTHTYNHIQPDRTHAVALHNAHAHTGTSPHPPPVPAPPTVRLSRKRSHSESDRERVQPLPIACILQGSHARNPTHTPPPTPTPVPPHTPHTQPPAPLPNIPTHTPLSNGGHPKPSRPPSLTPGKGVRKLPEQGPKRPHAGRARAVGPKAKDRPRDHRLLSGCLLPPSPSKPLYKKPVEKKGCKCGRATQNPSVLTCRGQRCPCYSNRKACLDCICRGCQNSYMANGEKKLEAFAVPEKALEQTRLTLGINLTSITAAAAALRNPATSSVHGNALINVTTATGAPVAAAFLSPSPPRDPAYEDSLDLGFHC